jgi:hypothetical protein
MDERSVRSCVPKTPREQEKLTMRMRGPSRDGPLALCAGRSLQLCLNGPSTRVSTMRKCKNSGHHWALPIILICATLPARAQVAGTTERTQTIGTPVFAMDGAIVGKVEDISTTGDGRFDRIRITTGSRLSFGERTIENSHQEFAVRRGAVVIDYTVEAVQALPAIMSGKNPFEDD